MHVCQITLGHYGILFTVDAVDDCEKKLKTLVSATRDADVKEDDIKVESFDGGEFAYAIKRTDSMSWIYNSEGGMEPTESGITVNIPGIGESILDHGVIAVLATTGWGKTTFLSKGIVPLLNPKEGKVDYISYLEPFEKIETTRVIYAQRPHEMLLQIAKFINSPDRLAILDSIRSLMYDKSVGGTGEGGTDAYIPVQLTALSNVLNVCGKTLMIAVNPVIEGTDEKEIARFDRLVKAFESSVPGVISGRQTRSGRITLRGMNVGSRLHKDFTVPDLSNVVFAKREVPSSDKSEVVNVDIRVMDHNSNPTKDVSRFINSLN